MRLIDADALIKRVQQEESQAQIHGREFSTCFMSPGGTPSTEWWFVEDLIENAPTIGPERKWVPVSERLPEKPNMYIVTDSKGDVVRFVFKDTERSREYWLRCAKAWMPLPEPYKEGEQMTNELAIRIL